MFIIQHARTVYHADNEDRMRRPSAVGFHWRNIEEYELADLLTVSPPLPKVWWLLGADAGMRRAEILNARISDVHGDRLHIPLGKGAKARWTIITSRTLAAIGQAGITDRVYPYKNHCMFNIWFRRCCAKADLPADLVPHGLRHRFATQLLRSGVNLLDIMLLLGHSSIQTTAIYLHTDPRMFSAARKALECAEIGQIELIHCSPLQL